MPMLILFEKMSRAGTAGRRWPCCTPRTSRYHRLGRSFPPSQIGTNRQCRRCIPRTLGQSCMSRWDTACTAPLPAVSTRQWSNYHRLWTVGQKRSLACTAGMRLRFQHCCIGLLGMEDTGWPLAGNRCLVRTPSIPAIPPKSTNPPGTRSKQTRPRWRMSHRYRIDMQSPRNSSQKTRVDTECMTVSRRPQCILGCSSYMRCFLH